MRRCGTRRLPAGPSAAWRRDSAEQFKRGAPAPKPFPFWGSLTRLGTRRGRSRASGASVPSKAEARCARPLRGGELLRGGVPPFRGGVFIALLAGSGLALAAGLTRRRAARRSDALCKSDLSGPRPCVGFARAPREPSQSTRRCSLVSYIPLGIIDPALALLHSKRSPNRRPAGLARPPGPSRVLVPRVHLRWFTQRWSM